METPLKTTNGLPLLSFTEVQKQREAFLKGTTHDYIAQEGGQVNSLLADADIVISGGNRGGGKANTYYTDIITPNGVVKMGELKVGDKICTPYEGIQTVEAIFEQGEQQAYRLYFDDGTSAAVTDEHRFMARSAPDKPFEVMTTKEIMERYRIGMEYPNSLKHRLLYKLVQIPMCGEIPMNEHVKEWDLPLHPYVLGCIASRGQIAMTSYGAQIAKYNPTAKDRVIRLGFYWDYFKNGNNWLKGYTNNQKQIITRYKPSGHVPYYRIPKEYLTASISARWEFVRGVLDISCNYWKEHPVLVMSNLKFLEDFAWMLRSLGVKCKIEQENTAEYWRLIMKAYDDRILFYSPEKRRRVGVNAGMADSTLPANMLVKNIIHIKRQGEKTKCRCIQVSGRDHLYLSDAFTVNHNTVMLLMNPMYNINNPHFNGIVLRKEKDDLANIVRESANLYSRKGEYNRSVQLMQWNFFSGAQIKFSYYADTFEDFCDRFQGRQYAYIGVDEITQMEWNKFKYLITTNRNGAHIRNRILGTCNPDPSSWVRKIIDWWIGEDGYPIPERNGVVRYCFMGGDTPEEITWGNSRLEVYHKMKSKIDELVGPNDTDSPENIYVKSLVFVRAELDDNIALLTSSPEYKANLAQQSDEQRERDFKGNWNFMAMGDDLVKVSHMDKCFHNDAILGDKIRRMTIDVAFTGGDAAVMWLWEGWHLADIFVCRLDPKSLLTAIETKREEWRVLEENIIYDLQGVGQYLKGFYKKAMPFNNQEAVDDKYKGMYDNKKSQCAFMFADKLIQGEISFEPSILKRRFSGKNYANLELDKILLQERKILRADESKADKGKCLIKKDQMKSSSILGRSPDFMESLLMRMLPEIKSRQVKIPEWLAKRGRYKVRTFT